MKVFSPILGESDGGDVDTSCQYVTLIDVLLVKTTLITD
jgi:hypothetical protein